MQLHRALPCLYFTLLSASTAAALSTGSCREVGIVFQQRLGVDTPVPDTPRTDVEVGATLFYTTDAAGSDLQVCLSQNLTCCTKKMEKRYQVAARRDLQNLVQTSSFNLKLLIMHTVASFQDAVEALVRQAQNQTEALLFSMYPELTEGGAASVSALLSELFTDVGLFLLGAELGLEEVVQRFFHALFPPVYEWMLKPGATSLPVECLRQASRRAAPFGKSPGRLVSQVRDSSLPVRLFLQALHLGVEVINTTEHLALGRECRRALLRMSYCPHCQALTASRPCMGYCLNVLRGCLADLAEVDSPWREFVHSLETSSISSKTPGGGGQNLEDALDAVPTTIGDAIAYAFQSAARLSSWIRSACFPPSGQLTLSSSVQNKRSVQKPFPIRAAVRQEETLLGARRREFLSLLRPYRTFYGGLADQLCVSELASSDGAACWNGADLVTSYQRRVVGSGVRAQLENPEVQVKEFDPLIARLIDKLKHVNQLLQGHAIPRLGTLDRIEAGSGEAEGPVDGSGDCDDEDGCSGSGAEPAEKPHIKLQKEKNSRSYIGPWGPAHSYGSGVFHSSLLVSLVTALILLLLSS